MAVKHNHTRRKDGSRNRSSTYCSWENMKQRCLNPKHPSYSRYGGRGVKICPRWLSFKNFLEDMGEKPVEGWHISRKNDEGDYEKTNCVWKSKGDNSSEAHRGEKSHLSKLSESKVINIRLLYEQGLTQTQLAKQFGVSQSCVSSIIRKETWAHIT